MIKPWAVLVVRVAAPSAGEAEEQLAAAWSHEWVKEHLCGRAPAPSAPGSAPPDTVRERASGLGATARFRPGWFEELAERDGLRSVQLYSGAAPPVQLPALLLELETQLTQGYALIGLHAPGWGRTLAVQLTARVHRLFDPGRGELCLESRGQFLDRLARHLARLPSRDVELLRIYTLADG